MFHTSFSNIPKGKSSDQNDLKELLLELVQAVSTFVNSSTFKRDVFDGSDENHYTEIFIKHAENEKIESRFSYTNQASLPDRRSTDIAIYLKANNEHYLFCIEAKFLPPTDYVTGEYAAIKRYKKLEHGLSSRNPQKAKKLPECAILAYTKSEVFSDHLKTINDKISNLANGKNPDRFGLSWNTSEQLQLIEMNETAVLVSKHQRTDNGIIKLHHFWVYVKALNENSQV
jgi:hypothetical protein